MFAIELGSVASPVCDTRSAQIVHTITTARYAKQPCRTRTIVTETVIRAGQGFAALKSGEGHSHCVSAHKASEAKAGSKQARRHEVPTKHRAKLLWRTAWRGSNKVDCLCHSQQVSGQSYESMSKVTCLW